MARNAESQEQFAGVETGEIQAAVKAPGEAWLAVGGEHEHPADYRAARYVSDGSSRDDGGETVAARVRGRIGWQHRDVLAVK
jgi:hypothetical protein